MNGSPLTKDQQDYIRANCRSISFDSIADFLDIDIKRVKYFTYKNKLRERIGRPFTQSEIDFIITHHRIMSYKEIGKQIGRSADSIKHKCQVKGWKRSPDEVKMLQEKYCSGTQFKTNHQPGNTLFDGAITNRTDSRGVSYKHIRLSLAKWEYLHIYNWEKIHGSVPQGMVLRSKDGDSLNCDPDNWELITQHENLMRNSGRDQLTDDYIISILTMKDRSLREDIRQIPELIELKREQLKLRRTIYERQDRNSEADPEHERKAISLQEQ